MKIIKSKGLTQKIITSITLIVVLFNIVIPTKSRAEFDWGGVLWNPIQNLVCGISDVLFDILQKTFIAGAPDAVYKCKMSEHEEGITGFFTNAPWILGSVFRGIKTAKDNIISAVGGDVPADLNKDGTITFDEVKQYYHDDIVFPSIYYSVENIFANKIPAFDVNFINPSVKVPKVIENGINTKATTEILKDLANGEDYWYKRTELGMSKKEEINPKAEAFENIVKNKINQIDQKRNSSYS